MLRQALIGADLKAVEIGRGDGVHHTGDRIRTIHRGSAILEDFNALQHAARDDVQVGAGAHGAARAGRRQATAVQHDQGAIGAQAAQRHGLDARSPIGHKTGKQGIELLRAPRDSRTLDDLCSGQQSCLRRHLLGDDLDRRRGRELAAGDT
ncbi:hypothetical protein D3C85_1431650 [compost metagenome]